MVVFEFHCKLNSYSNYENFQCLQRSWQKRLIEHVCNVEKSQVKEQSNSNEDAPLKKESKSANQYPLIDPLDASHGSTYMEDT